MLDYEIDYQGINKALYHSINVDRVSHKKIFDSEILQHLREMYIIPYAKKDSFIEYFLKGVVVGSIASLVTILPVVKIKFSHVKIFRESLLPLMAMIVASALTIGTVAGLIGIAIDHNKFLIKKIDDNSISNLVKSYRKYEKEQLSLDKINQTKDSEKLVSY